MAVTKTNVRKAKQQLAALLEYIALEGRPVRVGEAARAMNVEHRTVKRWLAQLTEGGLLARTEGWRLNQKVPLWTYIALPANGPKKRRT